MSKELLLSPVRLLLLLLATEPLLAGGMLIGAWIIRVASAEAVPDTVRASDVSLLLRHEQLVEIAAGALSDVLAACTM